MYSGVVSSEICSSVISKARFVITETIGCFDKVLYQSMLDKPDWGVAIEMSMKAINSHCRTNSKCP